MIYVLSVTDGCFEDYTGKQKIITPYHSGKRTTVINDSIERITWFSMSVESNSSLLWFYFNVHCD